MIAKLDDVASYIGPGYERAEVDTAWKAAEQYVADRCRWSSEEAPASLVEAVKLLTARYLARRKSPDGLIGMGEFTARVPVIDGDVRALIGPYRRVVLG